MASQTLADPSIPLTIEDFETGTTAILDPVNDTITFKDVNEELEALEKEAKGEKTFEKKEQVPSKLLTAAQKRAKRLEERQYAAYKECLAFETTVFHIITGVDADGKEKEFKTARFIVETILFQDPANAAARLAYLEYAELTGEKLEIFFRHESIKGKIKNLIDHIDQKTEQVNRYQKTRKICDKIAALEVSQVLTVCTEALKDLKPGKDHEAWYDKLILMIGTTIDGHKAWIESVRDFVFDHPKKDDVITETFKYVQKMLDSTHELVNKGVVTKKAEIPVLPEGPTDPSTIPQQPVVPQEEVQKLFSGTPTKPNKAEQNEGKKEEEPIKTLPAQEVEKIDPIKAYIKPVLFALFIYSPIEIKLLHRRWKKAVGVENK